METFSSRSFYEDNLVEEYNSILMRPRTLSVCVFIFLKCSFPSGVAEHEEAEHDTSLRPSLHAAGATYFHARSSLRAFL